MGLKSASRVADRGARPPRPWMLSRTPATLCAGRLSITTTSPGCSWGPSHLHHELRGISRRHRSARWSLPQPMRELGLRPQKSRSTSAKPRQAAFPHGDDLAVAGTSKTSSRFPSKDCFSWKKISLATGRLDVLLVRAHEAVACGKACGVLLGGVERLFFKRSPSSLGAIRRCGWVGAMTIEAPTDGEIFLTYLEQVLGPQLQRRGAWTIWRLHKVAGVRESIQGRGAELLYLPPYCARLATPSNRAGLSCADLAPDGARPTAGASKRRRHLLGPAHADMETPGQHFLLLPADARSTAQIVRVSFRHRLRVEAFARAIYIIAENALARGP